MNVKSEKPKPFINIGPGHTIKKYIEARGWSQKELAERSGMDATAVSKIENGGTGSLKLDTLLRLCAAMDYSPQEFFDELSEAIEARFQEP